VDVGVGPDALEFKAEPGCSCPRSGIERIALPSIAAIAEFIKDVPHHQVHCLGCGNATLEIRRVNNPADLDATSGRVNIQIAPLGRTACCLRDQLVRIPGGRRWPGRHRSVRTILRARNTVPMAGMPRGGLRDPQRRRRTTPCRAGCCRLVRPGRFFRSSPQAAAVAWVASLARAARAGDRWTSCSISEHSRSAATVAAALLPHCRSL